MPPNDQRMSCGPRWRDSILACKSTGRPRHRQMAGNSMRMLCSPGPTLVPVDSPQSIIVPERPHGGLQPQTCWPKAMELLIGKAPEGIDRTA